MNQVLSKHQVLFEKVRIAEYTAIAITHKFRIKILALIHRHHEITVEDIYKRLRVEQSIASIHLKRLRNARLVKTRRDGKHVYYSIDLDRLEKVIGSMDQLADMYNKKLKNG